MSRATKTDSGAELEDLAAAWVFRRANGLTPEEQAAFERWRSADPRHAGALARHERTWSALNRPRQAGQADLLLAQLAERASRRRLRRTAAITAAGALLVAGAQFWRARYASPGRPESRAVVVLPETQTLADGSIVELKPGAEIAVVFHEDSRRVRLRRGEAHFQVAHESRPFIVTAGTVEFRAVGTAFSVQLAPAQVELLVTEGRVAIGTTAGSPAAGRLADPVASAATTNLATVTAGNGITVALATAGSGAIPTPSMIPREEMAERLAWRVPKLEFTDTPLAEAVALMNRHNRVKLIIDDTNLGQLSVSGLFRADRLEAFVRLLEANFDVRAEQIGETTHLHRKR